MKKRFAVCVAAVAAACCGAIFAACGETEKTVTGISVKDAPEKIVYLAGEEFDVTGGTILVSYSDGSSEIRNMTADVTVTADTSEYGKKNAEVKVAFGETQYSANFEYRVVYSMNTYGFSLASEALPALNKAELGDVGRVIEAKAAYEALTADEKAHMTEHEPRAYEKVEKLELRLMPMLLTSASAKAKNYYEFLNVSNYSADVYREIGTRVEEFTSGDYAELSALVAAEEALYEAIEELPKKTDDPAYTLDDHKSNSIAALKNLVTAELYTVNAENGFAVEKTQKDYSAVGGKVEEIAAILNAVSSAEDIEGVDKAYAAAVSPLREIYFAAFAADAEENLTALFTATRAHIADQLARWTDDMISVSGIYDGINCDYLKDNRWWTPMPYRPDVILNSVHGKFATAQTVLDVNSYYEAYAFEIVRATMMRNIEMFYSIERNLNQGYDKGAQLYWANVSSYWGDTAAQAFTYYGIVDEYYGKRFGTGSDNAFRLSSALFKEGECATTFEGLIENYQRVMTVITPEPRAVVSVEISVQPTTTVFETGGTFTVAGGKILVTYNDTTTETVDMTDDMYSASDVDLTTGGSKQVTLTFTVNGEEKQVVLNYTVLSNADLSELVSAISALPDANGATAADIDAVKECVETYEALSPEQKEEFDGDYATEKAKLFAVQAALVPAYAAPAMRAVTVSFETLNRYDYSEENYALYAEKLASLKAAVAAAKTFAAADEAVATYRAETAGIQTESATLEDFLANAMLSAEKMTEVLLYAVTDGGAAASSIARTTVSLKEEAAVKAALAGMDTALKGAETLEEAKTVFAEQIVLVYNALLSAYRSAAENSVKALVADLKNTVKSVWEKDGVDPNGSFRYADFEVSFDYSIDVGAYVWRTPEQFRVSTLSQKLTVKAGASKEEIFANYNAAYVEMLRAVMYRNLFTVFHYNALKDNSVASYEWNTLYAFNAAAGSNPFAYDGTIEEYIGTTITVEYRLWHWGFKPNEKITTVEGLMEKYNHDLGCFLLNTESE